MNASTAIELRDVHKSFRMPSHRVQTLKERALHPFRSTEYNELQALEDVSFDIQAGEFMGIAGRNGSGKTTLLKLLASIYRADRGTIRIAGRVAPFIELGVGFNPDLAARDNVLLNGVMMGLSPKVARERYERVIAFAELEEFTELKLKNYSSGMRVRLGFAMLLEADAEILLIDEVLAVGDAAFQQKCTDAFYRLHDEGRTIVLVTHAMEALEQHCDRAVLLHEGRVDSVGEPKQIGDRYLELNFSGDRASAGTPFDHEVSTEARVLDFWLEDGEGEATSSFRHGDRIGFGAVIQANEDIDVSFGFEARDPHGVKIFHVSEASVARHLGDRDLIAAGERVELKGSVENPLAPGHYAVHVGIGSLRGGGEVVHVVTDATDFIVYGGEMPDGAVKPVVLLEHHLEAVTPQPRERASS